MRFCFAILLLILPFFINAQQETPLVDTTQQESQIIPLAEIPSEAERFIQRLNKDYQQTIYKSTIQDVQFLKDTLLSKGKELIRLSDLVLEQDIPYYVLETVLNRWKRFIPLIVKEENKLKNYSLLLSEVNEDLSKTSGIWKLTKQNPPDSIYPEAIENRIDEIIHKIDSVKVVLNDSLSKCLNLQNNLVDIQITAENYTNELTAFKTQTLGELLITRSAPIWALNEERDSSAVEFNFELLLDYSQEDVSNYFNSQQNSIITILALFVIFWLALLWMKSKYKELEAKDVKELELGKYIFSRAATAAFLFTIIIQSMALPQKPYLLELGIIFTLFILFIILIPGFVIKPLRWSVYLLSAVFLLVNFDLLFSTLLMLSELLVWLKG